MLTDIEDAEKEADIMRYKLKEKDQGCKINGMKIKELRRSIPRKTLAPLSTKNRDIKGLKNKGLATQYPTSIGSGRKAFNSTGIIPL
jgi:hypothetical protein